ncbi:ABC transporter substrate-binding protein [Dinoroseobacter sp. S76]|uniref:ABC transporter substrate-binding protein n=1 Tax=Dinoroseobacter sp. S76 TaxID=3415124 RepID=UPI003C79DB55
MKKLLCMSVTGLLLGSAAFADGQTLTVGTNVADAGVLDPHSATSTADKGLLHWMFNGLVRIQPGQSNPDFIEPDIAKSWTTSADGLTWTFALRDDVDCHGDYGRIDANDVVYSLTRASDADRSAFAGDFAAISSIEATGDFEVTITLANQIPSLLGLLISYHGGNIVCQDAVEALGDNYAQTPIGTGPFMFAEYQPQQFIRLVANPEYFRGEPQIKEIVYRYIPSDSTRDLAFQSGELDMMTGRQDQIWAERIKKVEGANLVLMSPGEMSVLSLNKTMAPLDNILVRQAIAHAINREELVAFRGADVIVPAISPVPEGNLGYTDDVPQYAHSVDRAKALLAEAGYPDGVTIQTIHTNNPGMLPTMEAVQAQLARAGINMDITVVEHSTFHEQIRKDLSQVVHYSALRFPVADVYLSQFFHSDAIVNTPSGVTNFSHCSVADAQIEAARAETDATRQLALWAEAQAAIMEDLCAVPLFQARLLWVWNDKLDLGVEVAGSLNLSPPVTELARFTD